MWHIIGNNGAKFGNYLGKFLLDKKLLDLRSSLARALCIHHRGFAGFPQSPRSLSDDQSPCPLQETRTTPRSARQFSEKFDGDLGRVLRFPSTPSISQNGCFPWFLKKPMALIAKTVFHRKCISRDDRVGRTSDYQRLDCARVEHIRRCSGPAFVIPILISLVPM